MCQDNSLLSLSLSLYDSPFSLLPLPSPFTQITRNKEPHTTTKQSHHIAREEITLSRLVEPHSIPSCGTIYHSKSTLYDVINLTTHQTSHVINNTSFPPHLQSFLSKADLRLTLFLLQRETSRKSRSRCKQKPYTVYSYITLWST